MRRQATRRQSKDWWARLRRKFTSKK
jgi:hypothetical protein